MTPLMIAMRQVWRVEEIKRAEARLHAVRGDIPYAQVEFDEEEEDAESDT